MKTQWLMWHLYGVFIIFIVFPFGQHQRCALPHIYICLSKEIGSGDKTEQKQLNVTA